MEPKTGQFPDMTKQIAEVAYLNNWHRPPAILRFLQEILSTFYRWMFDLVHGLKLTAMAVSGSQTTAACVEVAIVIILCLLAFIVVYVLWPRIAREAQRLNNGLGDANSIKVVESSRTLKQKAERFALNNDFDSAVKCLYLSALRRLHEQSIVPYLAVATNFEYCNLLASYPQVKKSFRRLADGEEFISFAQGKANKNDFEQCLLQLKELEELLSNLAVSATAKEVTAGIDK